MRYILDLDKNNYMRLYFNSAFMRHSLKSTVPGPFNFSEVFGFIFYHFYPKSNHFSIFLSFYSQDIPVNIVYVCSFSNSFS